MSAGTDLDLLVLKDMDHFPYIPGKTLKGLLKDSAETLAAFSGSREWSGLIETCFGKEGIRQGTCHFSNAEMTMELKKTIKKNGMTGLLYRKISATAIDGNGVAMDKTLRKIQTTIPLSLFFNISGVEDAHMAKIRDCLAFTRRMGIGRNRGLGRCRFTIQGDQK
jgi:CRISPR/Cas system CSM-associated protein Csm3 (group 7 of RAMP superfamily)